MGRRRWSPGVQGSRVELSHLSCRAWKFESKSLDPNRISVVRSPAVRGIDLCAGAGEVLVQKGRVAERQDRVTSDAGLANGHLIGLKSLYLGTDYPCARDGSNVKHDFARPRRCVMFYLKKRRVWTFIQQTRDCHKALGPDPRMGKHTHTRMRRASGRRMIFENRVLDHQSSASTLGVNSALSIHSQKCALWSTGSQTLPQRCVSRHLVGCAQGKP